MITGGNIKPTTAITVIDPKLLQIMQQVKEDTEAIKAKLNEAQPAENETPRYFPRGYFP